MTISGDYFKDNMKEVVKQVSENQGDGGGGNVSADNVSVTAGTDGLSAGTVQAALQALASRIQALEDA